MLNSSDFGSSLHSAGAWMMQRIDLFGLSLLDTNLAAVPRYVSRLCAMSQLISSCHLSVTPSTFCSDNFQHTSLLSICMKHSTEQLCSWLQLPQHKY